MVELSAIFLAIFSATLGALGTYLVRRRFDQAAATVKQFEFYHSDKMLAARTMAWDYLTSQSFTEDPKPLEYYYSGPWNSIQQGICGYHSGTLFLVPFVGPP